ncbi:MAG TPA: hypothetical protein VM864_02355 [Pyrinomonadaceae bacterium]|jgi:hypothetical protein|nr:hypothetical protein [Pyrinomonadaceae bacterium]
MKSWADDADDFVPDEVGERVERRDDEQLAERGRAPDADRHAFDRRALDRPAAAHDLGPAAGLQPQRPRRARVEHRDAGARVEDEPERARVVDARPDEDVIEVELEGNPPRRLAAPEPDQLCRRFGFARARPTRFRRGLCAGERDEENGGDEG